MPTYKGFNTINQYKKFSLTDFELIKRDLLNAFLTRQGEIAGRPDLGTTIWSFIFEQNTVNVRDEIETEVTRIIGVDPRLKLESINISYNYNTVTVETEVTLLPDYSVEQLTLNFSKEAQELYLT